MKSEIGPLLRLACPIILVQIGMMAMGVVDAMMVGRVSAEALAAVALGHLLFFGATIFGMGALLALDPVVAQACGAGDQTGVTRGVQRGLVLSAALTLPCSLPLIPAEPLFRLLGQPPEVVPIAAGYAIASIPGILPFLTFTVLRQSLQAMQVTGSILFTIGAANVANVFLNLAFVFGEFGFPALGAVGSGWASSISRWFMAVLLLVAARKRLGVSLLSWRRDALDRASLLRLLWLGVPIGAQFMLEYGAFATIGVLMGWLGAQAMAGHQIALNLASLTFMVPLGISSAAAVRVGHAIGRGDLLAARSSAWAATACGVAFMTVAAALFLTLPGPLARLYTSDAGALAVAAALIPLAGLFQIFDGLQVVSTGILRGAGDTRVPMAINVLGFWLMGMPVSLVLAFGMNGGPQGLWWGLVAGLAVVSTSLLWRVRAKMHGTISRVVVDVLK